VASAACGRTVPGEQDKRHRVPAALDVFKRYPGEISLVVLGLSMSGMSREEVLPELRKILRAGAVAPGVAAADLYSVRSERMLMEQLSYNLLFRWFVGLPENEAVWHPTVFTKNRDRLLEGAVAEEFFSLIVKQARSRNLLSDEHFTVDGTLIEAWAGQKSFRRKDSGQDPLNPPPPRSGRYSDRELA
jgi:hypothetical protein